MEKENLIDQGKPADLRENSKFEEVRAFLHRGYLHLKSSIAQEPHFILIVKS